MERYFAAADTPGELTRSEPTDTVRFPVHRVDWHAGTPVHVPLRRVTVLAEWDSIIVSYEAAFDKRDSVFWIMQQALAEAELQYRPSEEGPLRSIGMAPERGGVAGPVHMGTRRLGFHMPRAEFSDTGAMGWIRTETPVLRYAAATDTLRAIFAVVPLDSTTFVDTTEILIRSGNGVRVVPELQPVARSPMVTRLFPARRDTVRFALVREARQAAYTAPEQPKIGTVLRMSSEESTSWGGLILTVLSAGFPWLILAIRSPKSLVGGGKEGLRRVLEALRLFVITVAGSSFAGGLAIIFTSEGSRTADVGAVFTALIVPSAVTFWPLQVRQLFRRSVASSTEEEQRKFHWTRLAAPAALLCGAAALGCIVAARRGHASTSTSLASVIPFLVASAIWLAVEVIGSPKAYLYGIIIALTAGTLVFAQEAMLSTPLEIWLMLVGFFPMLWVFSGLCEEAWRELAHKSRLYHSWRFYAVRIVVSAALSFLYALALSGQLFSSLEINIASLVWFPNTGLQLALALCLLAVLRSAGRADARLPPSWAKHAALPLLLIFVPVPVTRLFYPALTYLLTIAFLCYWTLRNRRVVSRRLRQREAVRQFVVEQIWMHDVRRALRGLRRGLADEIRKPGSRYDEYHEKLREGEAAVHKAESEVGGRRSSWLADGPGLSLWTHGLVAGRTGMMVALPWIILAVRGLQLQALPSSVYEWIVLGDSSIRAFAQWGVYGLLFGYFYPWIRGSNGITKGITAFATLAVPSLLAAVLTLPFQNAEWSKLSFWVFQLFIHFLLLGIVVGDYETLRRAGLGRRYLVDIYNVPALTAVGSSLLVAVGAAIATVVQSGAKDLLNLGIRVLIHKP